MSIRSWPSMLKARSINLMQIMLIVSLGSVVLLRDSLGVGIDISLNAATSEAVAIESARVTDLSGPKRNIASVEEKNGRELESVPVPTDPTDFSYEQPAARWAKKPRPQEDEGFRIEEDSTEKTNVQDEVVKEEVQMQAASMSDEENLESEAEPITEFDKARQKRGNPRGKDVSNEDPIAEVQEVEHMLPREFTIPEDLQDLQTSNEPVPIKEQKLNKHKKQLPRKEELQAPKEEVLLEEVLSVGDNVESDSQNEQLPEGDAAIKEVLDVQQESVTRTESVDPKAPPKEPVFPGEPFSLGKSPKNWDQQRIGWFEKYPWMKTTPSGKQRILLITGSSPWACKNPVGDHVQLKSLKNKIDYARQHEIELFYNLAHLERDLTSYWAKLPIIRKLMLTHPEIEWFFWVDADAMFTDMMFKIPIERYEGYNIVMWGWEENLYKNRSWVAINDGAFLFRNCQWSLDLLDAWAPMGPEGEVRNKWGQFFSQYMSERNVDFPADDQSALVYLILNKPEVQSKIKLEWEYELSGYWKLFVEKFEEFMTTPGNHPGLGGKTWPFITHFTGCQPCTGNHNPVYSGEECALQMDRAYNFADNQVLQTMGFMHENLNSSGLKKIQEESEEYNIVESVGPDTWTSAAVSYGL